MPIHILTLPFDPNHQCFQDEDLKRFLLNKRVRSLQPAFFQYDGHPYWTVLVEYEPLLTEEELRPLAPDLPEERIHLLARLREWRKERAEQDGVPVFLIATNVQLTEVARRGPTTLESLRQINGFGRKKVERYGKAMVELVGTFLNGRGKPNASSSGQPGTAAEPPGGPE
jgi:superfamily II DNA helicase RecQ